MRAWRLLRGYSLARLGSAVHVSGDLLGKIEKAQRRPTPDLIERCDHALSAAGTLVRLYELAYGMCPADTQTGAPPDLRQSIDGSCHASPEQPIVIGFEHAPGVADLTAYRRRRQVRPADWDRPGRWRRRTSGASTRDELQDGE
ncbi:helix-turn-helix domain-containing protein [Dactylosporangium sp. CA-152071]